MEVTATEMNDTLNAYLITNEKSICPVLTMIRKNTKYINKASSEFAYVTVTTLDRIIIYHFDEFASYCEYFTFDTLIMGDVSKTAAGQYIIELSFLTEKGTRTVNMSVPPKVQGRDFPDQGRNAEFLYMFLDKKM